MVSRFSTRYLRSIQCPLRFLRCSALQTKCVFLKKKTTGRCFCNRTRPTHCDEKINSKKKLYIARKNTRIHIYRVIESHIPPPRSLFFCSPFFQQITRMNIIRKCIRRVKCMYMHEKFRGKIIREEENCTLPDIKCIMPALLNIFLRTSSARFQVRRLKKWCNFTKGRQLYAKTTTILRQNVAKNNFYVSIRKNYFLPLSCSFLTPV